MQQEPRHWIVKTEPAAYCWAQLVQEGQTAWTGVRNFQARNNLRAMSIGDLALFYHSVTGKEIVGIARVKKEAYPDPTAAEGDWSCVDLVPEKALAHFVTLEALKKHPTLCQLSLIRQSRLSVIPISREEFDEILRLGA